MKLTTLLGFCLCAMLTLNSANAQGVPAKINYQAVARNAAGAALQNQNIGIRFTIHSGSPTGTIAYQETHALKTNQFGLFTAYIGDGTVTQGNKQTIDWGNAEQFLQVEMDAAGGTTYTDMGTTQFVSVPYSLSSASAEVAKNLVHPYRWESRTVNASLEIINQDTTHDGITAIVGTAGGGTGKFNVGVRGIAFGRNTFSAGVVGENLYVGVLGLSNERGDKNVEQPSIGVWGRSSSTFPGSSGVHGIGMIGVIAESREDTTKNRAALELRNGYLKTTGEIPTAFVHTVTASNKPNGANTTELSYPGMEGNDVLIVTRRRATGTTASYGVSWINDKWNIIHEDATKALSVGDEFNVMVVKR